MAAEPNREIFADGESLRQRLWQELQRAGVDRQHEWRTPVLATTGLDALPQARTVVLREVRRSQEQLLIYTDARSPKVAELLAQPLATLLCWSNRLHWQLRLQLRFEVSQDDEETRAAWERVRQSPSASDYLAARAPGSPMAATQEALLETPQLAVLHGKVVRMDWLELARAGHRRARLDEQRVEWLVP
jgi:pyridoxine/pyridoxamine 5'-phosphate oxidase